MRESATDWSFWRDKGLAFESFNRNCNFSVRETKKLAYQPIDVLQNALANSVFSYTSDRKKAAVRALGTLVELVSFYTLRAWGLRNHLVIERQVPEFVNSGILHNVEFSLHRTTKLQTIVTSSMTLPLTANKLKKEVQYLEQMTLKSTQFLTSKLVKRNACVIQDDQTEIIVVNLDSFSSSSQRMTLCTLQPEPFAIFECKRVGVEEGMKKGPQTIEKAKQGAYVARMVSSLQKVRSRDGKQWGLIEQNDGTFRSGLYSDLLDELIDSPDTDLDGFILTVGVVSNHGNWFTTENPNKEMRVLAQSYDWLLFLTDSGLTQFVDRLLLNPIPRHDVVRDTFLASYSGKSGSNKFTKVQIGLEADSALWDFFTKHSREVETWYNVIAPSGRDIGGLRDSLKKLANKPIGGK